MRTTVIAMLVAAGLVFSVVATQAQQTTSTQLKKAPATTHSQNGAPHRQTDAKTTGTQAAAAAEKLPAKDRDFMHEAASGGMMEVVLGQYAAQNAVNPDIKAFGQRMVDDHTKVNDQLKQLAQAKGVTLSAKMHVKEQRTVDRLTKMTGATFDSHYIHMMVKDHETDIKAFEAEADKGTDPDVKNFAATTLPTLREHLKAAQAIAAKTPKPKGKVGTAMQKAKAK